jgi:hypothetical protein
VSRHCVAVGSGALNTGTGVWISSPPNRLSRGSGRHSVDVHEYGVPGRRAPGGVARRLLAGDHQQRLSSAPPDDRPNPSPSHRHSSPTWISCWQACANTASSSSLRHWPGRAGSRRPWTLVTGRFCARDESARNAGGTPGCGTADGAARRTRGTQTGSPPVPAGPLCQHRACEAPAQREASAALALPVLTRTAGTRVRTVRTGSLAPRPAPCHAAAVRAAGCPMRSCIHGKTAVCPAGTAR